MKQEIKIDKEKKTLAVVCTVCERKLFRAKSANIEELLCPKCKTKFEIYIEDGTLLLKEVIN